MMHLLMSIEAALIVILFGWVMLVPLKKFKATQLFIIQKLDSLMTKQEFLAAMADFKAEIGIVSGKVDALEALINNPSKDVDPEIVASFQDLKGSMDTLNSKADNTPASNG
jgi:hypothetical protein